MVKTGGSSKYAKINKELLTNAMDIFGRSLTLRTVTETVDAFGQISNVATTDTTFTGDLQFGLDIDQRFIEQGHIEVGDAVLYVHPDESVAPIAMESLIVDGNAKWEVIKGIEAPELGGTVCHYSYRCKRRPNSSDN